MTISYIVYSAVPKKMAWFFNEALVTVLLQNSPLRCIYFLEGWLFTESGIASSRQLLVFGVVRLTATPRRIYHCGNHSVDFYPHVTNLICNHVHGLLESVAETTTM